MFISLSIFFPFLEMYVVALAGGREISLDDCELCLILCRI